MGLKCMTLQSANQHILVTQFSIARRLYLTQTNACMGVCISSYSYIIEVYIRGTANIMKLLHHVATVAIDDNYIPSQLAIYVANS